MIKSPWKDWGILLLIATIALTINEISQLRTSGPKPGPTINFSTISDQMKKMTDAQWEAYCISIKGSTLIGDGWVQEVQKDGSTYEVQVSVTPLFPGLAFIQGVIIEGLPKNIALGLNRGNKVKYSGNLTSAKNRFGVLVVTLRPGVIRSFEN
jgi:hypothetical protein